MSNRIIKLKKTTLDAMADETHKAEVGAALKDLAGEDDGNFAILETGWESPEKGLKFLASPSVGPEDSEKICTGELNVNGEKIDVDAYRLA